MKRTLTLCLAVIAGLLLVLPMMKEPVRAAKSASKPGSCAGCHKDFKSVLPTNHPAVSGNNLSTCLACHQADPAGKPEANAFSARLHAAHENTRQQLECTVCHVWTPGKTFSLPGGKVSWGTPSEEDLALVKDAVHSWAGSSYMDSLHAQNNVTCTGCHGSSLPVMGDTVDNERCLSCHGSYAELAAKTVPKQFPDRNPHNSHLGEIACTACHHAHTASETYCLGCHPKFQINSIPGGAKK